MEVSAVIVARGGSVRVPNKNLLEIKGEPLIARKIRQLQQVEDIDRVIVGSDSERILEVANKYGAEPILRPEIYCDERVSSANEMIANMCDLFTTDIVMWTHCTNPLIRPETYSKALQEFKNNEKLGFDSLVSVYEIREHLWKNDKPLNYNPWGNVHPRASELEPLFGQDGGIFIQRYLNMKNNSYFFGSNPSLFEVPLDEVFDINTMLDFDRIKILIEHLKL